MNEPLPESPPLEPPVLEPPEDDEPLLVLPPLPPLPPVVAPPLPVPPLVLVPPVLVPPLPLEPPLVLPLPSVTLMVAPGLTVSFAEHLVSVEIGLLTLMLYAPGVSVTSPAFVSFTLAFMSDSSIGLFLGIGGFCRGPSIETSPLCAPPSVSLPVGLTVSLARSRMFGFLEAASTVFQTTSTSSPTFAVAGALMSTLVVPLTGGRPEIGGGRHSVLYETSAACAVPVPSTTPAPPSSSATVAAPALRCVLT